MGWGESLARARAGGVNSVAPLSAVLSLICPQQERINLK